MRKTVLTVVTLFFVFALASVSFAADMKAMGTINSVDAAKGTVSICPSGAKETITMKADKEMLKGVKAGDKVNVEYAVEGKDKVVKSMRKARGGKVPVGC